MLKVAMFFTAHVWSSGPTLSLTKRGEPWRCSLSYGGAFITYEQKQDQTSRLLPRATWEQNHNKNKTWEKDSKEKDGDIDAVERRRIRGTIQHVLHFLLNDHDSWTHKFIICYYHWIFLNRLQTDKPSKIREDFGSVPGWSGSVQQRRTAEEEWWVWDQDGVCTWSKSYFAWWQMVCFSHSFSFYSADLQKDFWLTLTH